MRTAATAVMQEHEVPADFTELYQRYYSYVVRLIISRGIAPSDAEDVAQIILTHFYRRNSLAHYSPDHRTAEGRQAKFTTFLSGFVLVYLKHHLDRARIEEMRRANMHPLSEEDPLNEYSAINRQGPRVEDAQDGPEYVEFVQEAHARLAAADFSGNCDLRELFEAMREQIAFTGAYNTAELAARFNAPVSTVQKWIGRLRTELAGM